MTVIDILSDALRESFGDTLLSRQGLAASRTPSTESAWHIPVLDLPTTNPKRVIEGLYVTDHTKSYIGVRFGGLLVYTETLETTDKAKVKAAINALKPAVAHNRSQLPSYTLRAEGTYSLTVEARVKSPGQLSIEWTFNKITHHLYSIEASDETVLKGQAQRAFEPISRQVEKDNS